MWIEKRKKNCQNLRFCWRNRFTGLYKVNSIVTSIGICSKGSNTFRWTNQMAAFNNMCVCELCSQCFLLQFNFVHCVSVTVCVDSDYVVKCAHKNPTLGAHVPQIHIHIYIYLQSWNCFVKRINKFLSNKKKTLSELRRLKNHL